jgi:hypothetical protein
MTTSMTMGLPGVELTPGDHICAFYRGSGQRDELLLPFLREGLRAGDKCLCVTDDPAADGPVLALAAEFSVDPTSSSGPMQHLRSDAAYLAEGYFATDRMIEFWDRAMGDAVVRDGFAFVRAAGEMTWALRELPGVEQLLTYEARLNEGLTRYPQVLLCLYDLEQFSDGQVLLEILRTHPLVLLSGQLLDNPWYVEPEEYLSRTARA